MTSKLPPRPVLPKSDKFIIYLDHNVWGHMKDRDAERFAYLEIVLEKLGGGPFAIPYSFYHVMELAKVPSSHAVKRDVTMELMRKITRCKYIQYRSDIAEFTLKEQCLFDVMSCMLDKKVQDALSLMLSVFDRVDRQQLQVLRDELRLDPVRLGGLGPSDAEKYIDEGLGQLGARLAERTDIPEPYRAAVLKEPLTVRRMVDIALQFSGIPLVQEYIKGVAYGIVMETIGYKRDKNNSMVAAFFDACHAQIASAAGVFISEDGRLRAKLGGNNPERIGHTGRVMSTSEFLWWFEENFLKPYREAGPPPVFR